MIIAGGTKGTSVLIYTTKKRHHVPQQYQLHAILGFGAEAISITITVYIVTVKSK